MATLLAMAIVLELMLHASIGAIDQTFEMSYGTFREMIPFLSNGCADGFPLCLGDRDYAIWMLCIIGIWQSIGFNMVLYLAGLTAVNCELHHTVKIDRAKSAWERFRLVTSPALAQRPCS